MAAQEKASVRPDGSVAGAWDFQLLIVWRRFGRYQPARNDDYTGRHVLDSSHD
jgi:hypothetical protein